MRKKRIAFKFKIFNSEVSWMSDEFFISAMSIKIGPLAIFNFVALAVFEVLSQV